jgi:DNA gyrase subunit A
VGICQIDQGDQVLRMTSAGKLVRFDIDEIGIIGRLTQGVRLISVSDKEKVVGLAKVQKDQMEEA